MKTTIFVLLTMMVLLFEAVPGSQEAGVKAPSSRQIVNMAGGNCILPILGARQRYITPQIKLTTEVLDKKYSHGDDDLGAVELKLKLQFTNQGEDTVLLYKSDFGIKHVWISESLKKMSNREFEQNASKTVVTAYSPKVRELKLEHFVVLSKGETYEIETELVLFVPHDPNKKIPGAISYGNHVLKIQAYSPSFGEEESKKITQKFKTFGVLLTEPIISDSMEFCLNKEPQK